MTKLNLGFVGNDNVAEFSKKYLISHEHRSRLLLRHPAVCEMSFLFWKVKVRASKKSNICETRESLHNFYFGIKKVELKKVYSTSQKCSADKGLYITIWINSFSALKPRQKFVFLIQKYVKNEIFMALCRDFYHFCPYYRTKEIFQIKKV